MADMYGPGDKGKATKLHSELLQSRGKKPRRGKVIICYCGVAFYKRPSNIKEVNFCSKQCSNSRAQKLLTLACKICGHEYRAYESHIKARGSSYCSRKCMGTGITKFRSGENNHMWRGGKSPVNRRIRASKQYADWRKMVFERDNFTCQFCGQHGGYLEPDHIKPFAYFPELRFELSNGRTLCRPCHKTTDTFGQGAKNLYELKI